MKIIVTLILLPFILIIRLIEGILGGAFGTKNLKYIPRVIEHLSNDTSHLGTAFDEIKFPQVLAYAEEMGTVTKKSLNYFEFEININSKDYSVKVSRAGDKSNCAVLRSSEKPVFTSSVTPIVRKKNAEVPDSKFDVELDDILNGAYDTHIKKCSW